MSIELNKCEKLGSSEYFHFSLFRSTQGEHFHFLNYLIPLSILFIIFFM